MAGASTRPDGDHAQCPKCERERKFHRTKTQGRRTPATPAGKHMHPMAGTIFEKSTTSLQLWFYAMYLMASTRCGISAKQLERELGVTYKTAWRMFNKIRNELMADEGDEPLRRRGRDRRDLMGRQAPWAASSTLAEAASVARGKADRARDGRARRARLELRVIAVAPGRAA